MFRILGRFCSLLLLGIVFSIGYAQQAPVSPFSVPIRPVEHIPVTDRYITYSPYNWFRSGADYAQSPNPGAYLRLFFAGTSVSVDVDTSPLDNAQIPAAQYPIIRYSVDRKPAKTVQLAPNSKQIQCASGLDSGFHSLQVQLVAGYVFLDFWTPVNVLRITGFTVDSQEDQPNGPQGLPNRFALFLGDSITNGDNTVTTFSGGVTNATETQDATVGYAPVVAAGIGSEYGVVAYGGACWDENAADGHTPGLMSFYDKLDRDHSRLVGGKFVPMPNDIFVNMGENRGPTGDDVPKMLKQLRDASSRETNIFLIVPFSGRARKPLTDGMSSYRKMAPRDKKTFLIDLGDNPYLTDNGPTMLAVDGQHPLAALDATIGAQLVQARANALAKRVR